MITTSEFNLKRARSLPRSFFSRDPRKVGRDLLGRLIVRKQGRKTLAGRIVEVEAYLGQDDLAAHAAAGRTARNEVIFGPPGHAYVYFIYGVHYCLNVSSMPEGDGGCVLIRALEPVAGIESMAKARELGDLDFSVPRNLRRLGSGPGILCESLGITRERDNGKDLLSDRSDLQIADDGFRVKKIIATTRIGISKSPELPLRYLIEGNPYVSGKQIATNRTGKIKNKS